MHIYIAFTEKQKIKIDAWKNTLSTPKGKRSYGILIMPTGELNEENKKLYEASMKSTDGHTFLVTKKAILS